MTDRELLDSIEAQIKAHRESKTVDVTTDTVPEDTSKELVIMLPPRYFTPPKGDFTGWVWPMPRWNGKRARQSDGFNRHKTGGHRQHLGVDIMYRNESKQKRDLPETTPWYHCPSDTIPMLAMGPGIIWFAGKTSTGWSVQIDHGGRPGFPLVTYYTHMSKLLIPEHAKGPGGVEIAAGTQLGYVGNSPKGEDPNHAHIEFWDYSLEAGGDRENRCLDPMPFLRCMGQVVLP